MRIKVPIRPDPRLVDYVEGDAPRKPRPPSNIEIQPVLPGWALGIILIAGFLVVVGTICLSFPGWAKGW